ncbi:hypothetical protein GOP47_0012430 [Adiantum capillus-veneris]|uniref:BRCT domain-containing protein n=1 Tax=Adiantum capillus-veneris TaxID=13818 RepID=A0A9D4ZEF0_ADICA|nr:hypothetical protein GOP47_0012430 [Adiantum capillus-veneris]
MADRSRAHVVLSVGCLKVAHALPSAPHFSGSRTASPLSTSDAASSIARGPFHGLIICVTGLSKDARKQVQEATMRMGGHFSGRKYEHALKHGLKRGLFVVTLAWFVNCVKQNERLDESLYSVRSLLSLAAPIHELSQVMGVPNSEHSCFPVPPQHDIKTLSLAAAVQIPPQGLQKNLLAQGDLFSGFCFYIDMDSSNEFQSKITEAVAKEGGSFIDHWFIGSEATHVVCEGGLMLKYLGFSVNLVTPFWVMKSVKERHLQRLVQLSADLARHVCILLEATKHAYRIEDGPDYYKSSFPALCGPVDESSLESQIQHREEKSNAAKASVRRRRGPRMQPCRTLPKPMTPSVLLESLCWSITELPSTAHFYTGSSSVREVESKMRERTGFLYDIQEDTEDFLAVRNINDDTIYTRPMGESEKKEIVFKGAFLTVLFPVDRFGELGPLSRCYYNEKGFCRQDILENIWAFYQEHLTPGEVEVALYTDSKHADKLRTAYASKEAISLGHVSVKRFEFLGSRKSFEGLKRVGRENTGHLYELLLAA